MSDDLYKEYKKEIELLKIVADAEEDPNVKLMFGGMAKFMKLILDLRVDMTEMRQSITDIEQRLNKLDGSYGV